VQHVRKRLVVTLLVRQRRCLALCLDVGHPFRACGR
jgi:hypothetical protein